MTGVASITIVGNLTGDPELKFTSVGKATARFKVIATHSRKNQSGTWEDDGVLAPWCVCWDKLAGNVAETLHKGMRVIVTGRLEERRYEDSQGQQRTTLELTVDGVGPDLRNATAVVTKNNQTNGDAWGSSSSGNGFDSAPPF